MERQIEDRELLEMIEYIPILTLQENNSLEGEITLTEASSVFKKYEDSQVPWL